MGGEGAEKITPEQEQVVNSEPEQLEALGQEIGFPVKHEDYIHEIIFKMP